MNLKLDRASANTREVAQGSAFGVYGRLKVNGRLIAPTLLVPPEVFEESWEYRCALDPTKKTLIQVFSQYPEIFSIHLGGTFASPFFSTSGSNLVRNPLRYSWVVTGDELLAIKLAGSPTALTNGLHITLRVVN